MKLRQVFLILVLLLALPLLAYGLDIDADSNDAVDIAYGGTNSSLTDPGADRLLFWDDGESLGSNFAFLTYDPDDFLISTTTFSLVAEIPHTDAIQTWTAVQTLADMTITKRGSAPTPVAGTVYYADNDPWDPAGLGGSLAYYVVYDGADYIPLFDEDGDWYLNKVQASMNVLTYAVAHDLTAAQMNSVIVMTAAGDVNIPDGRCDTATGEWITVKTIGTFLNSITSNDTTPDQFYLSDGTALTATQGWELDLGGAAGNQATVVCIQAHKWWVTGEIGICIDGGAGD